MPGDEREGLGIQTLFIRRVSQNDIELLVAEPGQNLAHIAGDDPVAFTVRQEILLEHRDRPSVLLDEYHGYCSGGQGLNPQRARPAEQVEHPGAGQTGPQYVDNCLFDDVPGRAQPGSGIAQALTPVDSARDTHLG